MLQRTTQRTICLQKDLDTMRKYAYIFSDTEIRTAYKEAQMTTGYDLKDALEVARQELKHMEKRMQDVKGFISFAEQILSAVDGNKTIEHTGVPQISTDSSVQSPNLDAFSLGSIAEMILREKGHSMHVTEISNAIREKGYRGGREIIISSLSSALKRNKRVSRFRRGLYGFKKSQKAEGASS